jgi:hypothetical protein
MALLGKHALFGTAVLAALGVPYALSHKEEAGSTISNAVAKLGSSGSNPASDAASDLPVLHGDSLPLEGPQVANLGEVFRFDITPDWLLSRWPRVMNVRYAAGSLQSYRVPLVTGNKPEDLAGALTYYFDERQEPRRIEFQGTTGDARPLAGFLAREHGLERRMTGDPSQYVFEGRRGGRVVSQLVVRSLPVIDASQPQSRFSLELVLERPAKGLSFPWL